MTTITKHKKLMILLLFALLIYTIKNIFVGADVDEGYGMVLGWRLVNGDRLFLDMWEPHQTSGIFTALFMKLILWLRGGNMDYLNLLLRVAFFLVQGLIAYLVCRVFAACLLDDDQQEYAVYFAFIYYLTTPKCIFIPEYSNLQVWFFTLAALGFIRYYRSRDTSSPYRIIWLVFAGFMLACDVLAYPSMLLLFPPCLILIGKCHIRSPLAEFIAFILPCLLGAGVFIAYIFSYMSFDELRYVLPHILTDGSHDISLSESILTALASFGMILLMIAGISAVAFLILTVYRKNSKKALTEKGSFAVFLLLWFLVQTIMQFYYWFAGNYNSGYPQISYLALMFFGIILYFVQYSSKKAGFLLILFSFLSYAALILLSNWEPIHLSVYLVMGLLGGLLFVGKFLKDSLPSGNRWFSIILAVFILSNVFGRCYLMIGGEEVHSTIFNVRGINRQGVRAGIFTSYMNAYRYNTTLPDWQEIAPDGSTVLYVGPSQHLYMLSNTTIAAPSTISTPTYDESLLSYWELNPERYPDVVAVESWFGDIPLYGEDSFIMQWLENEFQASEIIDYSYVRVYRK